MKSVATREAEHREAKLELIRARNQFIEQLVTDPTPNDDRLLAADRRYKSTQKNLHKAKKRDAKMPTTEDPNLSTFPPAKSIEEIEPMQVTKPEEQLTYTSEQLFLHAEKQEQTIEEAERWFERQGYVLDDSGER